MVQKGESFREKLLVKWIAPVKTIEYGIVESQDNFRFLN